MKKIINQRKKKKTDKMVRKTKTRKIKNNKKTKKKKSKKQKSQKQSRKTSSYADKGRRCIDQIFAMKRLVEEYLGKDKKLYAAFMDLEKAYDRVDS